MTIGDWGELGLPNLAQTTDKMLLNAAKCQGYSFNCLFIKRQPTGGKINPTQIRVNLPKNTLII